MADDVVSYKPDIVPDFKESLRPYLMEEFEKLERTIGSLITFTLGIETGGGGPANTDALPEGATNLYWTQARFDTAFAAKSATALNDISSVGSGAIITTGERNKLTNIEDNATADQTDAEIETAYNNRVAVVSQAAAEAGTATDVFRWTPERIKQAIDALASGGGGGMFDYVGTYEASAGIIDVPIPGNGEIYRLIGDGITVSAAGAQMRLRFQNSGGIVGSASAYNGSCLRHFGSNSATSETADGSAIDLGIAHMSGTAGDSVAWDFQLTGADSASEKTKIFGNMFYMNNVSSDGIAIHVGYSRTTAEVNDLVRVFCNGAPTITGGRVHLFKLRKQSSSGGGRETLQANRTYYVSTSGSDSNDGLSSGAPFLTIGKFVEVLYKLDCNGFDVALQLTGGTGTFTENISFSGAPVGIGALKITGDTTTPSNYILTCSSGTTLVVTKGCELDIEGFEIRSASHGISVNNNGRINVVGKIAYGAITGRHNFVQFGGTLFINTDYTISGGATHHFSIGSFGVVLHSNVTVTLTGTPNFSTYFMSVNAGYFQLNTGNTTYSGSATGTKHQVTANGVIQTFGKADTFFPGDVAGTADEGGVFT